MKQHNPQNINILKRKGSKFAGLLLMTLIGSLASAQAGLWGFTLSRAPTASIDSLTSCCV
jgi:hypothetical protein